LLGVRQVDDGGGDTVACVFVLALIRVFGDSRIAGYLPDLWDRSPFAAGSVLRGVPLRLREERTRRPASPPPGCGRSSDGEYCVVTRWCIF
jgi:hypothetical protein